MNDLRKDPVSGRWVIITRDYLLKRPEGEIQTFHENQLKTCPFCPGHEAMTPNEIWRWANPDGSWSVRVIPNKFPLLRIEGSPDRRGEGLFDHIAGIGAHEIIVETPEHLPQYELEDGEQMFRVLSAYKIRLQDLKNDIRLRYGLIFKNVGGEAGAQLAHPHAQLIAMPVIPMNVKVELVNCKKYYELKERCLFCDIISEELDKEKRIFAETEYYVAWAPYASRFPFETWIIPKDHSSCFTCTEENSLKDLGALLHRVLMGLSRALESPPFNYVLHTRPFSLSPRYKQTTIDEDFHWHIEIMPRLTKIAGFEWGSGFYINPTQPEEAAHVLREAMI
ncbi:MAG TPA: DUF4921 family protein [Candidatus Sumerlaeota bacterium]|nr:DUF4921 family protein [Candidatus Sumerlaeota bacterium]HON51062.1 DUF4921 family protein [Candidatus Sumerlaeota bacterium]HOR65059.1 DUF4921 family protein [Candidatus Sumerlaeota bacterium]HPL74929.1 DUF4921 family protein [Candidatus Sumerlaeota bacterium]HRU53046.1 DUF4921 family protein [Candidatus Sumerlaeia bacterium]